MTDDERRHSPRRSASIPGEIETGTEDASIAITRDVSATGLLLLARRDLAIGQSVRLKLFVDGEDRWLTGTVVRQEQLDPGESPLWRTKVGITVDPDDPVLAGLYKALTH